MNETGNDNYNTEFTPDDSGSSGAAGQSAESGQNNNCQPQYDAAQQGYGQNGQYYEPRPPYGNGQYYDQNANGYNGGQENGYHDGQQYYGPDSNYGNGQQYYGQNADYGNGQQYYGQNTDYSNGQQYYGPNTGYDQSAGSNNGQPYYGPNYGGGNGQYTGYNPNNGQQYYGDQQPYANPQTAPRQAQTAAQPVSNIFYYILMALTAISTIATIAVVISMFNSLIDGSLAASIDPESLSQEGYASLYALLLDYMANTPIYSAYSVFNSVFRFGIIVVSVIDIVVVRQKGYPILGMVLFTIFFKPGYFIWRAHVTKQRQLVPILFTVFYVLLYVGYFFWCFFLVFQNLV